VTDVCPLRCAYCTPENGISRVSRNGVLSYEQIRAFAAVLVERFGLRHVRITGGEPLVRPEIEKLVSMLAALGVSNLALTTNGQQLAGKAEALKAAGLRRVNISLDSLDPGTFAEITGGGILARTIEGIDDARRAGLDPIKLNAVVLRHRNDHEVADLVRFAIERKYEMRFLELMPVGVAAAGFDDGFVSNVEVRERLAREFTLAPLPVRAEETSRNFVATDAGGRSAVVGFISPNSEPFCAGCSRLRLTASGHLIGCLARPEGIALMPLLGGDPRPDIGGLAAAVEQALGMKRSNGDFIQPRNMVEIGG
jgi:cyclic pyranopterin phosphate synthase